MSSEPAHSVTGLSLSTDLIWGVCLATDKSCSGGGLSARDLSHKWYLILSYERQHWLSSQKHWSTGLCHLVYKVNPSVPKYRFSTALHNIPSPIYAGSCNIFEKYMLICGCWLTCRVGSACFYAGNIKHTPSRAWFYAVYYLHYLLSPVLSLPFQRYKI